MNLIKTILLKASTILLLIFIFIPSSAYCQSDWFWSHPWPTGQVIYNSYFVSANIGWICSYNSIYRTVDGGEEWEFLHAWPGSGGSGGISDLHSLCGP